MNEVMTMVAQKVLPKIAPAASVADAAPMAGALQETLKDPLGAMQAAIAGKLAGATEAPATGKRAAGEKVLRQAFLDGAGNVPWGQIETMLGLEEPVAADVRKSVAAALAGVSLQDPYVEVIQKGDDVAIQIEDHEMIVVGPVVIAPGFGASPDTGSAESVRDTKQSARQLASEAAGIAAKADERVDALQPGAGAVGDQGGATATAVAEAREQVEKLGIGLVNLKRRADPLIAAAGGGGSPDVAALRGAIAAAEIKLDEARKALASASGANATEQQQQQTEPVEAVEAPAAAEAGGPSGAAS